MSTKGTETSITNSAINTTPKDKDGNDKDPSIKIPSTVIDFYQETGIMKLVEKIKDFSDTTSKISLNTDEIKKGIVTAIIESTITFPSEGDTLTARGLVDIWFSDGDSTKKQKESEKYLGNFAKYYSMNVLISFVDTKLAKISTLYTQVVTCINAILIASGKQVTLNRSLISGITTGINSMTAPNGPVIATALSNAFIAKSTNDSDTAASNLTTLAINLLNVLLELLAELATLNIKDKDPIKVLLLATQQLTSPVTTLIDTLDKIIKLLPTK